MQMFRTWFVWLFVVMYSFFLGTQQNRAHHVYRGHRRASQAGARQRNDRSESPVPGKALLDIRRVPRIQHGSTWSEGRPAVMTSNFLYIHMQNMPPQQQFLRCTSHASLPKDLRFRHEDGEWMLCSSDKCAYPLLYPSDTTDVAIIWDSKSQQKPTEIITCAARLN